MTDCGCASRSGHLQVFLLIVFLVFSHLYNNTCAISHGYMLTMFNILF